MLLDAYLVGRLSLTVNVAASHGIDSCISNKYRLVIEHESWNPLLQPIQMPKDDETIRRK